MRRSLTGTLPHTVALMVVLCMPAGFAVADPGHNGNAVTKLSFEENAQATLLRIGVDKEPTFSVFTLRNPSRVLVEILNCNAAQMAPVQLRNGVVDSAALSVQSEGKSQRCRVILTLEGDAPYDVSAIAGEIVVAVEGRAVPQRQGAFEQQVAARDAELNRTKAELETAASELERLRHEQSAVAQRIAQLEAQNKGLEAAAKTSSHADALEQTRQELALTQAQLQEERNRAQALNASVTMAVEQVAAFTGQVDALRAEQGHARAQLAKLAAERDEAAQRAEVAEHRAAELDEEVQRLQEGLAQKARAAAMAESLQQRANAAADKQAQLEAELSSLRAQVGDSQTAAVTAAEERLQAAVSTSEALQAELIETRNAANARVEDLRAAITQKQQEAEAAKREASALKSASEAKMNEMTAALAQREKQLQTKEEELQTLRGQEATLRAELAAARGQQEHKAVAKQDEINEVLRRQAQVRTEMEQEVATLRSALSEREGALERARERETSLQERFETLQAERAREQNAVQTLLTVREKSLQEAVARENALRKEIETLQQQQAKGGSDAAAALVLAEKNEHLAQTALEQSRLASEVDALAARLEANRTEMERMKAQAESASATHQQREQQLRAEITHLGETAGRTQEQLDQARIREQALQRELAAKTREVDALNSQMQVAQGNYEAEVNALRARVAQGDAASAELEKARAELAEAELAREELKRIRRSIGNTEDAAAELQRLRQQVERAESLRAEVDRLRAQAAEAEAAKAELAKLRGAQQEQVRAEAQIKATPAAAPPIDRSAEGAQVSPGPAAAPLNLQAARALGATVQDIRFESHGSVSRVIIDLDRQSAYQTTPWAQGKATLVLRDAVLPPALARKLDTRAFNGAVRFVSAFADQGQVSLVTELEGAGSEMVRANGRSLVWEFVSNRSSGDTAIAHDMDEAVDRRKNVRIASAEPPRSQGQRTDEDLALVFGRRNTISDARLSRQRITLDVRDIEIQDLLRLIADEIDVSIVASPDVKGKLTLSLKSVPLDQALEIILRTHDLGMKQEGRVIWVAKAEVFREEQRRALEAAMVRERLEPLEVRLIPVNYATASELANNVGGLLSTRGTVQIDPRTNTLIIKDVPANLDAAEILVENLDTQTPQILIEARIVETQANFSRELGVQWGGDFSFSPANGNPTGLVFPSSVGVAGASTSELNNGTRSNPNFAVNLPASVGTGSGGAVGMTFGSVGGALNISLRLTALEEKGFVKIVSAPRIMTLDNVQASIEQGVSIPVSVVSAAGVQTVFFDAKLNLSVTPHVTRDGNIFLKIDVQKNEPDFANTGAQGDPSIIRKEAHTQLLIPDGDTTVIGGIYTRNTSQSVSSVPFFGSLPFVGYFFRKTSETDNRTELLIFITPRIINRELSIGAAGPGSFLAPEVPEEEEGAKGGGTKRRR